MPALFLPAGSVMNCKSDNIYIYRERENWREYRYIDIEGRVGVGGKQELE